MKTEIETIVSFLESLGKSVRVKDNMFIQEKIGVNWSSWSPFDSEETETYLKMLVIKWMQSNQCTLDWTVPGSKDSKCVATVFINNEKIQTDPYENILLAVMNLAIKEKVLSAQDKTNDKQFEEFKDFVLVEYGKGNIVFTTIEGPASAPLKEFIKQPASGILYDLNRGEEVVLTFIKDEKWVNDFAVAKTIRELKKRIDELENKLICGNTNVTI